MRPAWFAVPSRQEFEARFGETSTSRFMDSSKRPSQESLPSIPWDKLWDDDQYWLPLLFSQKRFQGRVDFGPDFGPIRRWWFGVDNAEITT